MLSFRSKTKHEVQCPSALDLVSAIKPFLEFSWSLVLQFYTKRCRASWSFAKIVSDGRTLLKGLTEFLPCCPSCLTDLAEIRCKRPTHVAVELSTACCIKIGAEETSVKLHWRVYRQTVWPFGNREYLGKVCYCVTGSSIFSGVLLPYSLILSLNEHPACALPVRPHLRKTTQAMCLERNIEWGAFVQQLLQCYILWVCVCSLRYSAILSSVACPALQHFFHIIS